MRSQPRYRLRPLKSPLSGLIFRGRTPCRLLRFRRRAAGLPDWRDEALGGGPPQIRAPTFGPFKREKASPKTGILARLQPRYGLRPSSNDFLPDQPSAPQNRLDRGMEPDPALAIHPFGFKLPAGLPVAHALIVQLGDPANHVLLFGLPYKPGRLVRVYCPAEGRVAPRN